MSYFCLGCKTEVERDQTDIRCECGAFKYSLGSDYKLNEGTVTCNCGNNKFKRKERMHSDVMFFQTWECVTCGNHVHTKVHI
jgi:hypothetical protein